MEINYISHPNPIIKTKVNYFAEYYQFIVSQLGKNSEFEIENILSLTEKIIFQLEYNSLNNVSQYLNEYLKNELISEDNKYFKQQYHFDLVAKSIDEVRLCIDNKDLKRLKTNKPQLLKDLKKFKTYLKRYQMKTCLNEIISFLQCSHKVEEHKEDIIYHTKYIAVELFYSRDDKAEIKEVFRKIISNETFKFPFCHKFEKANSKNLKQAQEKYIENRTFKQQFYGILNYKNKPLETIHYVLRIRNIDCENYFSHKIDNVSFYSWDCKKIIGVRKILDSSKNKKFTEGFFGEGHKLYAIVKIKSRDEKKSHLKAVEEAKYWLDEINSECETEGTIDSLSYLKTKDFKSFGSIISWMNQTKKLTLNSVKRIDSISTIKYLKSKKSEAKEYFLSNEKTFIDARSKKDLSGYWQYLENLLEKPVIEKFIPICSKELFRFEKNILDNELVNCFTPFNSSNLIEGLTDDEEYKLKIEIANSYGDYDYNKIKDNINSEFIKDLIELISKKTKIDNKIYISSILKQLYELRNFKQHDGNFNTKSQMKLINTVPNLVKLFRRSLINKMIENPKLTFEEILKSFNKVS